MARRTCLYPRKKLDSGADTVHVHRPQGRVGHHCGEEDDHIADFFIRSAFPPQRHIAAILEALDDSDGGLSVPSMQSILNLRKSQIVK